MSKKPSKRWVSAGLLACVCVMLSNGANAWVVFDPTNWIQNNVSAMKSIEEVQRLIKDYAVQTAWKKAQQEIQWAKGKALKGTDLANMSTPVGRLYGELDRMYGMTNQANQMVQKTHQEFAASNLPWADYHAREVKLNQSRKDRTALAFERERNLLEDVNRQAEKVKAMQASIDPAVGHQQALELLNSHMNLMVAQNSMLIQELSHQGLENASRQNEEDAKRSAATDYSDEIKKNQDESLQSINDFLN